MIEGPYEEQILDAVDVCSNCFRIRMVERIGKARSRGTLDDEFTAHFERRKQTTEIAYGPAESVTDQKGVFCTDCGTESPHHRVWDADDIDKERFKGLIVNLEATLRQKGVDLKRETMARVALQAFEVDERGPDESLSVAVDAGTIASVAHDSSEADAECDT
jgi:hypothetical protein